MVRILLADDQPEVRSALRLLLEQEPCQWAVIGEAADVNSLLEIVRAGSLDLILLDWELPGLKKNSGLNDQSGNGKVIAKLRRLAPKLSIVVLSGRTEARLESIAAGADGFVSKGDPPERLLSQLNLVKGAG
jgi:DNA-binding NarL/FixJ family response regulator